jgi:hypothetical protein
VDPNDSQQRDQLVGSNKATLEQVWDVFAKTSEARKGVSTAAFCCDYNWRIMLIIS